MLLKLFLFLFFTYPVLSQYEINPIIPVQFQPKIEEQNEQSGFNNSESLLAPLFKQETSFCPANEALIQIQNILMKLLGNEDEKKLNVIDQQGIGLLNKESPLNLDNVVPNVLRLSKGNSLRQLLENNHLNSKYKTKVTVHYEIPNEPEFNCKQALSNILQVLKNSNLMHDSYRSCGPYDIICQKENILDMKNIGNQNVFTTNINQGNNNYLPNMVDNQKLPDSLLASQHNLNTILKYLALKRNPDFKTFENYGQKQQRFNDIKIPKDTPESIEKLTQVFNKEGKELVQNILTNHSDKSTPYQLHITENIIPPTDIKEINQKVNVSEILAENSKLNAQVFENNRNQALNVDEKPDDVLVTVTNDGKIVSVYPSKTKLYGQGQNNLVNDKFLADYAQLQNKENVASHVKNLLNQYLQGNVNNLPNDKMNALLAVLKTEGSKSQYKEFPQELLNGNEHVTPYYVNPNLTPTVNQYPMINPGLSNSVRQFPYKGLNNQLHANLNVFNQISNQENLLNQHSLYQPYMTGNPYVNSKLVDYEKHVNELHVPYNLGNSQRFVGETNQGKLNSQSDNSGVVELTYLLKRPHPVVYQPVYYVKYRLPYDSFVNNLRDLVRKHPQLRSNRAKLYRELLALSKVAEVSPNLKGLGQQQLLQMVANNGALVKTKVLKVNETLLDKQLKTVQDLNSKLTPTELGNEYKGEPVVDEASMLNKTIEIVMNKTQIRELENFERAKQTSSNLDGKDIFNLYKTTTNKYLFSTDKNPSNSIYSLV